MVMFLLLLVGYPELAQAQKYPLELSRSQMSEVDLGMEAENVDIRHDHASLLLPILPFESFMFVLYLKEDQKDISFNDFADDVTLDGMSAMVPLADFPETLVNSTRGAILAVPIGDVTWVFRRDEILSTDYEEISSDDRAFMNQILYRPQSNEKGKWFYGVSHLGGIAKDSFYPLLGYVYRGDSVRVNMVLPSYFIIQFKLGEYAYFLIDETVTSESYRLTEDPPWENAYLSQTNLVSRFEIGLRFKNFEIGLSYGRADIHSLTINDSDHNELQKWDIEPAPVTSLQLQWNL